MAEPVALRTLAIARGLVVVGLIVLGLVGIGMIAVAPGSPVGWIVLGASIIVALAQVVVERAELRAATDAQAAEAAVHRLLQGLGRSTSPDAVVATIVDALRGASGADHVVVARRRPGDRDIEAILVSTSMSVPLATTRLPADLLASATGPGRRAGDVPAEAAVMSSLDDDAASISLLVDRLQAVFGLRTVIARPLQADEAPIGALVLSRRREEAWSTADVMLLETAATELTIALQRAGAQQAAELGARMDALTGLPNRGHFDELAELLTRGRRAGDALGVLMIDIDHFKRINDTFGHAVGDAVLRAVAQSIASGVRAADTPARFGGEEFAVLLRRATTDQACDVALRIRAAVASLELTSLGVSDGRPVSVSIGVAVGEADGETVAELVQRADGALYAAKRRGRDRVVVDEVEVGRPVAAG